jgi:ABC-type lipoprotein export system ATPase subunit
MIQKSRKLKITIIPVIVPLWILFILVVLNISLTQRIAEPIPTKFKSLVSKCPTFVPSTECIAIGYSNNTNIDPLITILKEIVTSAEPDARVEYLGTRADLVKYQEENPSKLVAGVDFTNATLLQSPFNFNFSVLTVFTNNTVFVSGFDEARYITASLYAKAALTNYVRQASSLPFLMSPGLITETNGVRYASVVGKQSNPIKVIFPFYIGFMFGPIIQGIMMTLNGEKEKKVKYGLIVMGTSTTTYLLAAIAADSVFVLFTSVIVTIVMVLGGLFTYTNFLLLFILVFGNGLLMSVFGAFLSVFFASPKQAVGASNISLVLLLAIFGICQFFVWKLDNLAISYLLMLLPLIPFCRAIDLFTQAEMNLESIGFANVSANISMCYYMLFIDILLFTLLAFYLDRVFPGEGGGNAMPFNFVFRKDFWFPKNRDINIGSVTPVESEDFEGVQGTFLTSNVHLSIRNLTKTFPGTEKRETDGKLIKISKKAVDNFSIELIESQIMVLLGHNGAGKTTLISNIIGMLYPTSGNIYAKFSTDLLLDVTDPVALPYYREHLGICPQHDSLFDELTVQEHLKLFIGVKGVVCEGVSDLDYINTILRDVDLADKLNEKAGTLSGGQKRKLR